MSCSLLYVGLSQYNYKPVSQRSRVAPHVTLTLSGDPSVSLLVILDKKNITRLVRVQQNHLFIEQQWTCWNCVLTLLCVAL